MLLVGECDPLSSISVDPHGKNEPDGWLHNMDSVFDCVASYTMRLDSRFRALLPPPLSAPAVSQNKGTLNTRWGLPIHVKKEKKKRFGWLVYGRGY